MKRLYLFFCLLLFSSVGIHAQNLLLSQEFKFTDVSDHLNTSVLNTRYVAEGVTFNNVCYGIKGSCLQLGDGSKAAGSVTFTKANTAFNGKAKVVIYSKIYDNNSEFQVTINNTTETYQVSDNIYFQPTTIIVNDWTPSTQVTITKAANKERVLILQVDVYEYDTSYFYESFNGMDGPSQFTHNDKHYYASANSLDNSGSTISSNVRQSQGAIHLVDNDSYHTPQLSCFSGEKALLTYKYATAANTRFYTVSISGETIRTGELAGKENNTWFSDKVIIPSVTSTSSLVFAGEGLFFDDILLRPIPDGMSDGADNGAFIEANDKETMNVTVTRTLTKDIWNTMCLPFNVTSEMFGTGAELRTLTSADGGDFIFNKVETVEAGTPFLVKVKNEQVGTTLTFDDVTVENVEPAKAGNEDYKFCGTYSPVDLNIDGTHIFLGTDTKFHKPTSTGNRMNGMRAYFEVPASPVNSTRVSILDEPSAIHSVEANKLTDNSCYDLTGRRHDAQHLSRGLYVRNGKKYYVK